MLDEHGYVSGREVHEGDVIGKVGNYFKKPGGTTYHLHFDVQVPTRQGWVFVNPYMTLVAAYERLIGGRGELVNDKMMAGRAVVAGEPPRPHVLIAPPSDQPPQKSEGDERQRPRRRSAARRTPSWPRQRSSRQPSCRAACALAKRRRASRHRQARAGSIARARIAEQASQRTRRKEQEAGRKGSQQSRKEREAEEPARKKPGSSEGQT